MIKSAPLRQSARGQECMIRIPGVCNGDPSTTVLAHMNGGGMGMKHHDLNAAFSCSDCHNSVDGRSVTVGVELLRGYHLEGVIRTQQWWVENGYLTWKGCDIKRKDAQATERLALWLKRMAGKFV